MAHLSSCYFCGTALDEPLATYSVGAETTVTLCPTCHRKLETVLETAGGSIGVAESPDSAEISAGTDDGSDSPEPADVGSSDAAADEGDDGMEWRPGESNEADSPEQDTNAGEADDTNGADSADSTDSADRAGRGSGSDSAGTPDISTAEYNKVIRLLQNREFPVKRAEIVTVATNAYGLSERDCGAVIDRAVDRGVLDETDGELRHPE